MELYEYFSRAWMRKKYRRIDGGSRFVVKRKRVKVAHLQEFAAGARRRTTAHRLRLRCFRLRFLVPGRFLASLKAACMKLMQVGKAPIASKQTPGILMLPKSQMLRSSTNDVVDEAWFNQALRRSIAEGRLTI